MDMPDCALSVCLADTKARQRLGAFLLRHARVYREGKSRCQAAAHSLTFNMRRIDAIGRRIAKMEPPGPDCRRIETYRSRRDTAPDRTQESRTWW